MPSLSRAFPLRLKDSLKVLLGRARAVEPAVAPTPQTSLECPVCGNSNVSFLPLPFTHFRELDRHQFVHSIFQFETLNLEHYICASCGASDRDRLYAVFVQRTMEVKPGPLRLLEIAPSAPLTRFLRSVPGLTVRTGDLFMENVDDQIDITNMMQYRDGQFDAFICSHVLEHVPEDRRAMRELKRILAPNGWGIVMTPVHLGLSETVEDPTIVDAASRWHLFGQDDHVRVYAKTSLVNRLQECGLRVHQFGREFFGEDVFRRHGIHIRSVLYVVTASAENDSAVA